MPFYATYNNIEFFVCFCVSNVWFYVVVHCFISVIILNVLITFSFALIMMRLTTFFHLIGDTFFFKVQTTSCSFKSPNVQSNNLFFKLSYVKMSTRRLKVTGNKSELGAFVQT